MRSIHAPLLAALLLLSSPVLAQERTSLEVARDHMEQGQTFYLQGRFEEAATEFEAAYAAEAFSAFLFNAGVSYENAGQLARGLEFFGRYLERDPSASDRAEVEARMERLRAEIQRRVATAIAEPPPDTTTPPDGAEAPVPEVTPAPAPPPPDALPEDFKSLVSIRTTPEGATVRITSAGGEVVSDGPSPLSQTLSAGTYHVSIDHPDFNRAEADIEVEPGKVYLIVMNLSQGEFLGYLHVVSDPPGAQVFIDDHEAGARGESPWEGSARIGTHHVWIERAGYDPIERDVEVTLGADTELRETLERARVGRIRVIGNIRGAQIFVDGAPAGAIPWEGEVASGVRHVRVESSGMKAWEEDVEVARGQLSPIRVRLRPAPGRGGAYVAGAFTVLALAGGVTLSVLATDFGQQIEHERDQGTLASDDPRIDQGFAMSIAQYGGYGLGAILLGVTIYYAVVDDLPPSEATVLEPRDWAILPMFDPNTGLAGVAIGGRL
jgi:tetratricopeptide (TPR) repeat protein